VLIAIPIANNVLQEASAERARTCSTEAIAEVIEAVKGTISSVPPLITTE
jgi:hypothetical protein